MKRLTIYSTLFLALCLSAWGLSWYALTTLRSETRSMDRELSFFNEQEERYQKTIPQRIVDEKRFRQFPSTIEKFREMAVQHRQIAGRRQAVADGVFQKYLDKILASAKEREKRIRNILGYESNIKSAVEANNFINLLYPIFFNALVKEVISSS